MSWPPMVLTKTPIFLEHLMSVNTIKCPKVVKDKDAIYVLLVRLLLLEPGTNQAFPEMGLGLVSRYRYSFAVDINKLIIDYKNQIATYLPGLEVVDILGEVVDKTLILKVNIDNEIIYPIAIDTVTMKLRDITATT